MDKKLLLINLYDYYGLLLTDRQRSYFENYYFNDYSLAEIAENDGVSRNAVHGQLKIVEEKLFEYEDKLKLFNNSKEIKKLLSKIEEKEIREKIEELI
jgi:predicted DNA-binding protein YlxM (UPF0122 family)